MRMSISLLAAISCMAVLSTSAFAQAPGVRGEVLKLAKQHIRHQHHPTIEQGKFSRDGRRLQMFEAAAKWDGVVEFYKDVYARGAVLTGGLTVGGYFVNTSRGYATVTLYSGGTRCVLRITQSVDGTSFALWSSRQIHR